MGPVAVEVEELPVPVHPIDGRPLERLRGRVEGLEHTDRSQLDLRHGETGRPLAEEVDERLHLGQLGHAPILPNERRWEGGAEPGAG
jgi:hypothetical protein